MGCFPVLLLAGGGQQASDWDLVKAGLPAHLRCFAPQITIGESPTLAEIAHGIGHYLDEQELAQVAVCGLSLGAMAAVELAHLLPKRVSSLFLSGVQVRPNRAVMALQQAIMRLLPSKLFTSSNGLSKTEVLRLLAAVQGCDLARPMRAIAVPTMVVCGSRDLPNRNAARLAARLIPEAELRIVSGVGHAWNVTEPALFAQTLAHWLQSVARNNY